MRHTCFRGTRYMAARPPELGYTALDLANVVDSEVFDPS
jgi:hypothetical protein